VAVESAKAYCGVAHVQSWNLDAAAPVPEWVDLDAAGGVHRYRLVHDSAPSAPGARSRRQLPVHARGLRQRSLSGWPIGRGTPGEPAAIPCDIRTSMKTHRPVLDELIHFHRRPFRRLSERGPVALHRIGPPPIGNQRGQGLREPVPLTDVGLGFTPDRQSQPTPYRSPRLG